MLLLNPGPVTLSERVRKSLLQTDLCHREPEFFDLQDEARKRLVAAYELDPSVWSAVLMTGSGTAAVESMIAGLVPEGGRLLVVENGVYGDRIAQIAKQYGIDYEVAKYEWMQAPDIDAIIALLDSKPFTNVAIIHHETTTGRLNAIDQLSRACKERGLGLLLDAVSSFGAEAIDFDGGGIAAIAATSASRVSQSCRTSAIRRSRRRCMRITRSSKRCASSKRKAAGARVTRGMQSSRSRSARDWLRSASTARCRPRSRRSCCGRTGCLRASRTTSCTMRSRRKAS
jgi:hypothetical protein